MLKALKTMLKDDIINQNTWRIKCMGTQQALTTEQLSVLLWLKVLDEFKDEGFENATFDEKYNAFEAVEDTGISRETYDKCVKFWINNGVIKESVFTHKYSISKNGYELFKHLDELQDSTDSAVSDTVNELLKANTLCSIHEFIKKHPQETLMVMGLALQAVQIVIAV